MLKLSRIEKTRIWHITLIWTGLGLFISLYDYLALQSSLSQGLGPIYSFMDALIFNLFAGCFGGILGALAFVMINRRYRSRPYYKGLIAASFLFICIVSTITLITALIPTFIQYGTVLSAEAKTEFYTLISDRLHLKNTLFWAIVATITMFGIQISDKFGPGNLSKMVRGTYHTALHESRIFMFLDLKDSTTIAEQLGEAKYHSFLKEIFADITEAILETKANIYQYVGDEIVVSWPMSDPNSFAYFVRCFVQIQSILRALSKYNETYGAQPIFKAGAHGGKVIAGEIGIIKREITYSGDVLNTTARIQSQCNALQSLFLVSKWLYDKIPPEVMPDGNIPKGPIALKGKEQPIELYSLVAQ